MVICFYNYDYTFIHCFLSSYPCPHLVAHSLRRMSRKVCTNQSQCWIGRGRPAWSEQHPWTLSFLQPWNVSKQVKFWLLKGLWKIPHWVWLLVVHTSIQGSFLKWTFCKSLKIWTIYYDYGKPWVAFYERKLSLPAVVSPDGDLEDAAAVALVKEELLLEQRVQGPPRRRCLGLGEAALAAHQVHLHPGRRQHLGARLALQPAGADNLTI